MNPRIIKFVFNAFTVFALIFFLGRVAFGETVQELKDMCKSASTEISKIKCDRLDGLAKTMKTFKEIPADGSVCKKATETYDALANAFYACSTAGTSGKGTCFSICREVVNKLKNDKYENADTIKKLPKGPQRIQAEIVDLSKRAELCNRISRQAQKIRFDQFKAPSCEYDTQRRPAEYIDTVTVRPVQNNKPGFRPIEEVEAEGKDKEKDKEKSAENSNSESGVVPTSSKPANN